MRSVVSVLLLASGSHRRVPDPAERLVRLRPVRGPVPIVLYLTATAVYMSHDTPPWTQALGGVFTGIAGAALLLVRPTQTDGDAVTVEPARVAT